MPRAAAIPAILRGKLLKQPEVVRPGAPRLWNAKRRIKSSRGLIPRDYQKYLANPSSDQWRSQVSEDVVDFIDKCEALPEERRLLPEEKKALLRYPARFFSRPHHVPVELREQVYFPSFGITLRRTPNLGPFYAAFDVPLEFNKLDMKSYLKEVYNVDVVHIRSTVIQRRVGTKRPIKGSGRGRIFRAKSLKKMTVQLVDPFVWPDEVTDFSPWERDEYWRAAKQRYDFNQINSEWGKTHVNEPHRNSIAEQARDLLAGRSQWKPTWQSVSGDTKRLSDLLEGPPPPPPLPSSSVSASSNSADDAVR